MITDTFVVYTDGAHKNRWGSWAYVILRNNQAKHERSGRVKNTNSLRMEIQAVIEALKFIGNKQSVEIRTDCRILIENVELLDTWKQHGWVKKNQAPIPNVDRYQKLYEALATHKVNWVWVKAHSSNQYNERCDYLCRLARGETSEFEISLT